MRLINEYVYLNVFLGHFTLDANRRCIYNILKHIVFDVLKLCNNLKIGFQLIHLFTDTAVILNSIVFNSYYGMLRGTSHNFSLYNLKRLPYRYKESILKGCPTITGLLPGFCDVTDHVTITASHKSFLLHVNRPT